jgi:hypothetical protein
MMVHSTLPEKEKPLASDAARMNGFCASGLL